jgi:hypothetical protein
LSNATRALGAVTTDYTVPLAEQIAKLASAYPVVSAKAQVLVLDPEPAQYMAVKDRQAETTGEAEAS